LGLVVALAALLTACASEPDLQALSDHLFASPELSFVEAVNVVEVEGESSPDGEPPRLTTFFEFEADQREQAVDELLRQGTSAGFMLSTPVETTGDPVIQYTGIDNDGFAVTITVSDTSADVELTANI